MKKTLGLALVVLALGGAALDAYASPAHQLTPAGCSPNGKAVWIGGKSARVYCGPARAAVRIGSQTMTFRNGTCVRIQRVSGARDLVPSSLRRGSGVIRSGANA